MATVSKEERSFLTEYIQAAADEAAASPNNDTPEPSYKQQLAGNYKKGHLYLHGLPIAIETPKSAYRSGVDTDGEKWRTKMSAHYGYIKGTKGADGDALDVFIGEHPESNTAYIVKQVDPATKKFDEHKIMLGYLSENAAKAGYLASYEKGWQGLGEIFPVSIRDLREKLIK